MFVVTETEAALIRHAFEQGGETAASVVLRKLFRALPDDENTRASARKIAEWTPQGEPRATRIKPAPR